MIFGAVSVSPDRERRVTKSEYRDYIASAYWQEFRRQFLQSHKFCAECALPRWLAQLVYDQDLHVHHLSYANLGHERLTGWDLLALCRRCHELETFGHTNLRPPPQRDCPCCLMPNYDVYEEFCFACQLEAEIAQRAEPWAAFG